MMTFPFSWRQQEWTTGSKVTWIVKPPGTEPERTQWQKRYLTITFTWDNTASIASPSPLWTSLIPHKMPEQRVGSGAGTEEVATGQIMRTKGSIVRDSEFHLNILRHYNKGIRFTRFRRGKNVFRPGQHETFSTLSWSHFYSVGAVCLAPLLLFLLCLFERAWSYCFFFRSFTDNRVKNNVRLFLYNHGSLI